MGYAGTVFILAHPILLIVLVDPSYIERVNPITAPWAGRFGMLSILCLLVVIVTSVWRLALRISYEVWQGIHLVLSTIAVTAALVHVELIHHYVNQPWKRALWVVMAAGFLGADHQTDSADTPPVDGRGGGQGARRSQYGHVAARRPRWVHLCPRPVRLAVGASIAIRPDTASILVLV
jgi:Ferric reductase like transmembrane component